ncbi:MAG TPA: thiamine-monophosphate kinase [Vicinamibacterales bacterium]|nr:thiamine-monophosphate kinase [Vicinamibacterales bacterium]
MGPTVATLTERELVARLQQRLPPAPDWLIVGIGDDAAVVEPERNRVEVLTVDAIVEGIHFDRTFTPPAAIGHRALAVNLSDLAAMGAAPRLALLSMALPAALPIADYDAIVDSFASLARMHRLHVVGGNLTRSPDPLMIDVTVAGSVKRRQALTRAGARAGDEIYVSGTLGSAAAGLATLAVVSRKSAVISHTVVSRKSTVISSETDPSDDSRLPTGDSTDDSGLVTDDSRDSRAPLVRAFLFPQPRVRLGVHLARNRAASACVDLSDGLADGLHRIAEASGVGVAIDAAALPIDPATRACFESGGDDPVVRAMTGGDDYELLFTVRPRTRRRLEAAAQHGGVAITRIGECTADGLVVLRRGREVTPVPGGFTHFADLPVETPPGIPRGDHDGRRGMKGSHSGE